MLGNPNVQKANKRELRSLLLFFGTLGVLYGLFVSPHVDDFELDDTQCRTLNHLWQTKYSVDFDFSDAWTTEEFDCLSENSGMARALYFLDHLQITSPEREPAIDFYQWAKDLRPQFHKRSILGFSGIALFEKKQIDLNLETLSKNNPLEIAGTLIHELRHLEEGYNSHVKCLKNEALTCDKRLEDHPQKGGAYNYNIYFYHQVRQFSNASFDEKRLAKKLMQTIFDNKFNAVMAGDRQKYQLD